VILIDARIGNSKLRTGFTQWSTLQTDFLEQIHQAGVEESDVNLVACTHLHVDHVGWNTHLKNGVWAPTFPNARYLFARQEYGDWVQNREKWDPEDERIYEDSIRPVVDAGLVELVEGDHILNPAVRLIPTPGHTAGHVSVRIESGGHSAIITGDCLHHPCQIAHPEWSSEADAAPVQAAQTRRRLLDEIAGTETLLIGSHFANPAAGKIERLRNGFFLDVNAKTQDIASLPKTIH
jgi:glyoxylase-like metal-dependent hydrolase (beta-lactamase superfamily II)